MLETINYRGVNYLKFQAKGNASQFAIPFAKHLCKGFGVDIGFSKEEWKFPGAIGADLEDTSNKFNAENLPPRLDYIYSSHCLEHLDDWVRSVEYWISCLNPGGILFLYLPHPDQEYWLPWNNRKHKHIIYPSNIKKCFNVFGMINVFCSKRDLNYSYIIVGEKG